MDAIAIDQQTIATGWSTGGVLVHQLKTVDTTSICAHLQTESVIIRLLFANDHVIALTEKGYLALFPFSPVMDEQNVMKPAYQCAASEPTPTINR